MAEDTMEAWEECEDGVPGPRRTAQRSADGVQRASGSSAHSYRAASSLKRWACRSTLGMQACVSGQKTRSFRRLTAPPCSIVVVVAGRAHRHELSRALVQQCARESPPVLPISSAARNAEGHVDVGMRWRCSQRQPMAADLRDLLGVLCAFSRHGPPSDPNIEPPSAVVTMSAIHVSTASIQRRRLYVLHAASHEPRASFAQLYSDAAGAK